MNDSKHNQHATETPDVSHIKNVDVTHETSDVDTSGIAKFVVGLSVMTIAVFVLMSVLFGSFDSRLKEPAPPPMALSDEERLPPEPRLQGAPGFAEELEKTAKPNESESATTHANVGRGRVKPKDPLWEIKQLNAKWNDVLEHGPVDQNGKRYGMPIEQAKEEILRQGLPVRKQ
jgi:hypothetical protein